MHVCMSLNAFLIPKHREGRNPPLKMQAPPPKWNSQHPSVRIYEKYYIGAVS